MSKLLEARDILAERGLAKGVLEDSSGCLCPLGALNMAYTGMSGENDDTEPYAGNNPEHQADIQLLAQTAYRRLGLTRNRLVAEYPPYDYIHVYRYNDRKDNTLEDSLSLFTEVANG